MVREIIRDIIFLQQKAVPAVKEDAAVAQDLKDTLEAHLDHYVGHAANMIGVNKAIIVFREGNHTVVMYNPEIVKHSPKAYDTEEGCLSLSGVRPCKRYETLEVTYRDAQFKKKKKTFQGFTAEIIQHELDHLQGILI